MRPFQRKLRLAVPFDGEGRALKAIYFVAGRTIGILPVLDKLTSVIILMTIETLIMRQRISIFSGVTIPAFHLPVFPSQRVIRTLVVNIGQVVDLVK